LAPAVDCPAAWPATDVAAADDDGDDDVDDRT